MRSVVIVFLKFPLPGRVKTRIAAEAGEQRAVEIYEELVKRVGAMLRECKMEVWIAYTLCSEEEMASWLRGIGFPRPRAFLPQCEGDLGVRQAQAVERAFQGGYESVTIIGADCPEISAALLEEANDRLAEEDLVFGPTEDGGYYLMAAKSTLPAAELFAGVAWSTKSTLRDCLENARRLGLKASHMGFLKDIDFLGDWLSYLSRQT